VSGVMTAKLLNRPYCGGMLSHTPGEDATRSDLQDNKHMREAKADSHGREEVRVYGGVRMTPQKRGAASPHDASGAACQGLVPTTQFTIGWQSAVAGGGFGSG
jgi:hypothetical protein